MSKIFIKIWQDRLLTISMMILLIVSVFSPLRLTDIDWRTIISLTTLMLGVGLFNYYHVLAWISEKLISLINNQQQLIQLMVIVSFLAAMILTNDVSIITLIPIYLAIASKQKLPICLPVTLITIAANLGSSLTPFGNPQNLFLANYYHLGLKVFALKLVPVMLLGLVMLLFAAKWIEAVPIKKITNPDNVNNLAKGPVILVSGLMLLTFAAIFHLIPLTLALLLMVLATLFLHRSLILHIDYGILITFICFFLSVGGLGRLSIVNSLMSLLMTNPISQYFSAIISSQLISNVPSAILLSRFTSAGIPILLGVNVGGLGTLVASLANLLAFKSLMKELPNYNGQFLKTFSLVNGIVLLLLTLAGLTLII